MIKMWNINVFQRTVLKISREVFLFKTKIHVSKCIFGRMNYAFFHKTVLDNDFGVSCLCIFNLADQESQFSAH